MLWVIYAGWLRRAALAHRRSRTRAGCEDQRKGAEDEGERRHQDRAEAQAGRLDSRFGGRHALLAFRHGELNDQNGAFRRQPDQHHNTDLRIEIKRQEGQ